MYMLLNEKLRNARITKGIKAKFIAEKLGKSPAWVSAVESGRTKLNAELLQPYAEALGVSVSIFFEENVFETKIEADAEHAATSA